MRFCHPEVNDVIKNGPADKVYKYCVITDLHVIKRCLKVSEDI